MSRDCCVALPRGAMGLSIVCDFGISYSLAILHSFTCICFDTRMNDVMLNIVNAPKKHAILT